jgi:hypothetical protein
MRSTSYSWRGVTERSRLFSFAAAAVGWTLVCLRWFDAAAPLRPRALEAVPVAVWALLLAVALAACAWSRRAHGSAPSPPRDVGMWVVVALAVLFRLPMAWQGAAGYVTADGALSGLMALDAREGRAHDVFVPHVPYSGSLKAILTAPLAAVIDPARAFALVSVLFYAAFVAAVYRLGAATARAPATPSAQGLAAGLYAAFSPAFVTRYSLSNDGNYVEVLALGTWALVLALRWAAEPGRRRPLAFAIGLLIGLAFWCHILAVIPAAAVAVFLLLESARDAVAAVPRALLGFALGDLPGLLWNAANGWESFAYLVPGGAPAASSSAPSSAGKAWSLLSDQLPVLLGYDFGYPATIDRALMAMAVVALVAATAGLVRAARAARGEGGRPWRLILIFAAVNLGIAWLALPYIPGNPRYLLFSMAVVPVLLAEALSGRIGRMVLAVVIATGALASLAQAGGAREEDRQWRAFVRGLQSDGVRACYTDFYLATKINFLSGESVTCSAKLGPTTTEYFFRFREAVDAAPEAALIAVNQAAADKLERRLERLGVTYERRDLMKPVLFRLSRKVGPEELFPDRAFPLR